MKRVLGVLAIAIGLLTMSTSTTFAGSGYSFGLGTDNFYLSVGNYDYYPYTLPSYGYGRPRVDFHSTLGEYGSWTSISPYGQCWRPYVTSGWRPYVNGHWVYTSYGPTWSGYEPWGWIGYHYGNWIFTERFGWVWIPGYDWHPGRVVWSYGHDTIGWMPAPPVGYDYGYYNGAPYYGSGYYEPYYRGSHSNFNLWVFINTNHFGYRNYADYYLDRDYTRRLFDNRLVRIQKEPLQRSTLERIVKRKIDVVPVRERQIETSKKVVKAVVPVGEEENIRKHANRVVEQVIAPAFAEKRKSFKGVEKGNKSHVDKLFRQEGRRPEVRRMDADEVVRRGEKVFKDREEKRERNVRSETEKIFRKEQPRENKGRGFEERNRDAQFEPKSKGSDKKQDKEVRREVRVEPDRDSKSESRSKIEKSRRSYEPERGRSYEVKRKEERKDPRIDARERERELQRESQRRFEEKQKSEREAFDRRRSNEDSRFRAPERRSAPAVTREDNQKKENSRSKKESDKKNQEEEDSKKKNESKHRKH